MCKDKIFLTNRQIITMNISIVYITILDEAWFIQLPHYILINNINTYYNILHNFCPTRPEGAEALSPYINHLRNLSYIINKVGIYDIWNNSTTPPLLYHFFVMIKIFKKGISPFFQSTSFLTQKSACKIIHRSCSIMFISICKLQIINIIIHQIFIL